VVPQSQIEYNEANTEHAKQRDTTMREALPAQLWLGNAVDGRDVRQLFQAGVRAVVDLAAEELPASLPREVIYCRFPLIDSAGNSSDVIRLAVSTLVKLLRQRVCTLVCCS